MDPGLQLATRSQALRARYGSLPRLAQRHAEFLAAGRIAYAAHLQEIHDAIAEACGVPTLDQLA